MEPQTTEAPKPCPVCGRDLWPIPSEGALKTLARQAQKALEAFDHQEEAHAGLRRAEAQLLERALLIARPGLTVEASVVPGQETLKGLLLDSRRRGGGEGHGGQLWANEAAELYEVLPGTAYEPRQLSAGLAMDLRYDVRRCLQALLAAFSRSGREVGALAAEQRTLKLKAFLAAVTP